MQHFYDGQIRRYVTQMIRLLSNFTYKDGKGALVKVPVMYGDITRQVGHILRDNSENKIPSAPRISVYISGLQLDRDRISDSTFVSKVHLRERTYDSAGKEYLNTQGKNVTVERLMPTPYTLELTADIWSTNTDQKLQIMEQILMMFNPSLEIQTTDNYVDWTSLSVVELDNVNFSSRSIPVGTESEIDVSQLGLKTPIYISPPTKVKKLGVITNIVMSIFDESKGTINLGESMPELKSYSDGGAESPTTDLEEDSKVKRKDTASVRVTTYNNLDILVMGNVAKLIHKGKLGGVTWTQYVEAMPGVFRSGLSQLQLSRTGRTTSINGAVAIDSTDDRNLIINWDTDTFPTDKVIAGSTGNRSKIDYIIDPTTFNPTVQKNAGTRFLLLGDVGSTSNTDGPDAWKNADNTDFVASVNDIVEWDGSKWSILFDASENTDIIYQTNLNTGIQYKWTGEEWVLSFEGEYRNGTWHLLF
jgi:hypothetical protein|tara:strand:+ start:1383 stop:2804 length:1422 start_codon:yes stop_codon:yes gene_type:complete